MISVDDGDSDIEWICDSTSANVANPAANQRDDSVVILSDSPYQNKQATDSLCRNPFPVDFACGGTEGPIESRAGEPWMLLFGSADRIPREPSLSSPEIADVAMLVDDGCDSNRTHLQGNAFGILSFDESISGPGRFHSELGGTTEIRSDSLDSAKPDCADVEVYTGSAQSNPTACNVGTKSSLLSSGDSGDRSGDVDLVEKPKKKSRLKAKLSDEEMEKLIMEREEKRRKKELEDQEKRIAKELREKNRKEGKLTKKATKLEKQALRDAYRPVQGGKNSLEYLRAHIPTVMVDALGRKEIEQVLEDEGPGINYVETEESGGRSGVIYWTRGHVTAAVERTEDSVTINKTAEYIDENNVLIQIPKKSFVAMIDFYKQAANGVSISDRESLHSFIEKWRKVFPGRSLHFFVYGMEKYFRQQLANLVHGDNPPTRSKPPRKSLADIPYNISYEDLDDALLDLMCRYNLQVKQLENPRDFARCLITMHKAIADLHLKNMKKQEMELFDALSANTKTKGVTVSDDKLDGYRELWIRQLEQFSLISRDVAVTIANLYPSPRILMKAYQECRSEAEKERLLEDVIVRRGTERRIGPKMSRTLYRYMCSTDGEEVLE